MNKDNDSIASYIGPGANKRGPFYCNHCNRKLDCLNQDTREYLCVYCNISYYPDHQNVKRANNIAVAIYFVFSKLNPVRKVALSAPPVPTKPVIRPEMPPPVITIFL